MVHRFYKLSYRYIHHTCIYTDLAKLLVYFSSWVVVSVTAVCVTWGRLAWNNTGMFEGSSSNPVCGAGVNPTPEFPNGKVEPGPTVLIEVVQRLGHHPGRHRPGCQCSVHAEEVHTINDFKCPAFSTRTVVSIVKTKYLFLLHDKFH